MLAKSATNLPIGDGLFHEPSHEATGCTSRTCCSHPPRAVAGRPARRADPGLLRRLRRAGARGTPERPSAHFETFEGAGLDGVVAKPSEVPCGPDQRLMTKVEHVRTADCVVAGSAGTRAVRLDLRQLLEGDGTLFARYAVRNPR